ncbi:MAG: hypothetical protein FJ125_15465 [Deltaproteobacteria bacterium]|nr:hypothetical protein [Deltaproteobacteria bacterium]
MAWFLLSFTDRASSAGTVLRADDLVRDEATVSLLRDGRTVFVAPTSWVADVGSFDTQQEANQRLKELLAERNRYRSATPVAEEHVVIRPPRPGEVGWGAAGLIEAGGVTIKLAEPAQPLSSSPGEQPQQGGESPSSSPRSPDEASGGGCLPSQEQG